MHVCPFLSLFEPSRSKKELSVQTISLALLTGAPPVFIFRGSSPIKSPASGSKVPAAAQGPRPVRISPKVGRQKPRRVHVLPVKLGGKAGGRSFNEEAAVPGAELSFELQFYS